MSVWLRTLNEKIQSKIIYGFDTETIGKNNDFYLGTIYGDNLQKIFYSQNEMIDYLNMQKFKRNTLISATNLQFDILSLFKNSMNMIQPLFRNSQMFSAFMTDDNKRKTDFIDTFNFVPYSVATLGKILKIPKMEKPKRLGKIPQTPDEINYLSKYCMRDSEISCKFLQFIQKGYNEELNTNMGFTVASSSMKLFRKNYLSEPILQPKREIIKQFYESYYGGRTETFQRGHIEKCKYYDINSLYPTVMMNEYPNPNSLKFGKSQFNLITDFEGISEITIEIPKGYTFLLPCKYGEKTMKKLIFPTGKIKGWFSHIEIRKAIEHNAKIKSYGKSLYYTKNFTPFKEYVLSLYKKRMDYKSIGNPMEILYKLSLNSLYGKFAQKIENKQEIIHADRMTEEKMKEISERQLKCDMVGDYFYITNKSGDGDKIPSFVNPIFSVYTTAYARLLMFEKMKESGEYYYMDTDSLITKKNINTSLKLGDFKKEYDIIEGKIIKPKMYGFIGINEDGKKEDIIRCKGLPIRDDYNSFISFLKTKKAKYIKFAKFKECIRSNENQKLGKKQFNQIIEIAKTYDLEDNKRIWKNKFNPKELQNSKPIHL